MKISSLTIIKRLLLVFLLFGGLYFAKALLIPVAISVVMATLFLPFCKWMEGKSLPRGLAVTICILVLLILISSILAILGWQISGLTNDFEMLMQKLLELNAGAKGFILDHLGISFEKQESVFNTQLPILAGFLQRIPASISSIFTDLILILIYVLFLLLYRTHLKQFLLKFSAPGQSQEMERVIYRVAHVSQEYLLGLSKMIVCLWIMYGIGFSALGIKNALFFAFLCGLLEIVPFVGNITGTTLTVLVAIAQGAGFPIVVGILAIYGVIQFIQGWLLEPLIVGSEVRLNPLFTIISLVIGNLVWGLPGIFLAIPLMAMFKIVCDHIESLRSFGFLIGEIKRTKSPFFKSGKK